jgi:hypothetical protein
MIHNRTIANTAAAVARSLRLRRSAILRRHCVVITAARTQGVLLAVMRSNTPSVTNKRTRQYRDGNQMRNGRMHGDSQWPEDYDNYMSEKYAEQFGFRGPENAGPVADARRNEVR